MKTPLKLDPSFNDAIDLIENTNTNIFITGRAGTGKSTLLNLLRKSTTKKHIVLAPTGVAALNVGGQTIHSFCSFPPRPIGQDEIREHRNKKLYKAIQLLIIDEISMVRADLLDNIDWFFRVNRENGVPFGGVQVVLVGDLYQLPPVVSSQEEKRYLEAHYTSPYFFSAQVFLDNFQLEAFELTKVYRQEEKLFLKLLEEVRNNSIDDENLNLLNERCRPDPDLEGYITLCARKATAEKINKLKLQKLNTPAGVYQSSSTGNYKNASPPAPSVLTLKEGAQVMFVKNDKTKRYVNGTIGIISELKPDSITVTIDPDPSDPKSKTIELEKETWEIIKYGLDRKGDLKSEVLGTYTQYPVILAWAITIHKSQGKTFDKVIIDLGSGAFDFGQTYVALSRCRTLGGIILSSPLRMSDIAVDEVVIDYYRSIQ